LTVDNDGQSAPSGRAVLTAARVTGAPIADRHGGSRMRSDVLRATLAAAAGTAAVAVAGVPQAADSAPGCAVVPSPDDEAAVVSMTNATRRSRDRARLRRDDSIGDAARRWSVRMARTGALVHSELGWSRGRRAGENIAYAGTARDAYRAMLGSPPHRRNILGRAWRFVGIGVVRRCDGVRYVTMNLMAPPSIRLQPS
jgi:uncharacterized protein YkwD